MQDQKETTAINQENNHEEKQYFINNEKFELLRQCQQEIYEKTEMSPSIRKLVNALINEENLNKMVSKFINNLSM